MGPLCEVRVLGAFEVAVDGEAVSPDAWRSRRAADVVKLLALEPTHRIHREQLMDLLWPALPADAAAANLRKAIHYARRAMGSDSAIDVRGGMVVLWPEGVLDVDLDRFERGAADALTGGDARECARAAAAYTGEVLPADRYEEWAGDARERAHDRYVLLLVGAEDWERVLELDPTDERAHRVLMRRFLDAGDRREAIRQFERLRDTLREHIGVGPDPITVSLYVEVLGMEGAEPPTPGEQTAVLLSRGLGAWGQRDLPEAERLAREARELALDADLPHELGEASTLLALVASASGTWHDLFREQFADSIRRDHRLEMAVYDAHLCFLEYYLYGPEGHRGVDTFARELLDMATEAGSDAGRALATLLLGDFALLSGDLDTAASTLTDAVRLAEEAKCDSVLSMSLERLAETGVALGDRSGARDLLARAGPVAAASNIPSHLVIRIFGVNVLAASRPVQAMRAVADAERWIADAPRVCDPCSMGFLTSAARAGARAGELSRAARHLSEAERISGLWGAGPWVAAIWETMAEIRRAEGQTGQAAALYVEAAQRFAELQRPLDEARCRREADSAAGGAARPEGRQANAATT
jgi:DNA-binding SARP family transcriptional activator